MSTKRRSKIITMEGMNLRVGCVVYMNGTARTILRITRGFVRRGTSMEAGGVLHCANGYSTKFFDSELFEVMA
jgi:hypothetical protein